MIQADTVVRVDTVYRVVTQAPHDAVMFLLGAGVMLALVFLIGHFAFETPPKDYQP